MHAVTGTGHWNSLPATSAWTLDGFIRSSDAALKNKEYYVKMRMTGGEEGRIKSIPISARQLESTCKIK